MSVIRNYMTSKKVPKVRFPWTVKTFPCTIQSHFVETEYFCSCAILQTSVQLSLLLVVKNINEIDCYVCT